MVVDYLKKCINYTATKKSKNKDEEDDDVEMEDKDDAATEGKDGETEAKKPKSKKKKNNDAREIRRPIIFICNNLYSKALRPLKDIALSIKISSANNEKLLKRLRDICRIEDAKIEDRVLRELC